MNISGIRPCEEFYECSTNAMNEQEVIEQQVKKSKNIDTVDNLEEIDNGYVSIDIIRAISAMKKDQVIHQYQFFVGNEGK